MKPDAGDDLVEEAIARIAPYEPGKPIEELERELGHAWGPGGAIKLASNENPYGPSPKGVAAATRALQTANLYPDGGAFTLRQALAKKHGVDATRILVGSGTNEIIDLLTQALCADGDEVLAPRYSFIAYKLAAEKNRRAFVEAPVRDDFDYDVHEILAAVTPKTKLLFFANPNNPTGVFLERERLKWLVEKLPPRVVLVADEAYFEYVTEPGYSSAEQFFDERERLVVLRTFSKIYGLAGLRVGYAIGSAELVGFVNRIRLPFNVSSVAQAAAIAALDDKEHVQRAYLGNAAELSRLSEALSAFGITVTPSQTNFVLAGFGARDGRALYDQLLRRGVIVRPLGGYGLPHHLRITVGTREENDRLIAALRELR